jgi:hypothetical protein
MWKRAKNGKKVDGIFDYFNHFDTLLKEKSNFKSPEDLLSLDFLDRILAIRSAQRVYDVNTKLEASKASNTEKINSIYAVEIV